MLQAMWKETSGSATVGERKWLQKSLLSDINYVMVEFIHAVRVASSAG